MGAQLAVHAKQQQGVLQLNHFTDIIVVKLELEQGSWVIFGRVLVDNFDSDDQTITAKIIHDANVIIDEIDIYAGEKTRHCLAVQATWQQFASVQQLLSQGVGISGPTL